MAFKFENDDDVATGLHEINVTPFIDVMLVLLIIFMVAAPLATVNVPLDLPVSSAHVQPDPQHPVIVSVQSDLRIFVGDDETSRAALGMAVKQALGKDQDTRIFLRADKGVTYGDLMNVMDALRGAGYQKIALVTLDQPGA